MNTLDASDEAHELGRLLGSSVIVLRVAQFGWQFLEKEIDRNTKNLRNLKQTASADTISAFFVFLDLLKCQPQFFAQFFLADAEHYATQAHTIADMNVYRVRRFAHGSSRSLYARAYRCA